MHIDLDGSGPVLVFGGPYSNLEATAALRAEADRLAIPASRVICTGDIVAYCADPEATSQSIATWGCHAIQGNCEEQLAAGADDCGCNFTEGSACDLLAKGWYPFARSRLSPEMQTWMGALPRTLTFSLAGLSGRVVHGGTTVINRWVFASDTATLAAEMADAEADLVLAGHAGLPFIAGTRHGTWFNAGVIGMPANDGTPEVWYGLLTPEAGGLRLSTHRLTYDHRAAAAALRRHGHANGYARTLVTGLWPSLDILPDVERVATGRPLAPASSFIRPHTIAATAVA